MFFQRPRRKYIGGFLIASGAICLLVALISALYFWHFVRTASHADGKIIRMIEQQDNDGTAYFPVFTFRDAQGAEHTIHSSSGSFPPDYEVGDTVPVLYSPTDPTNAKIGSLFSVWGISLITGILGGIDLPAGFVVWFWPAIVGLFRRRPPVYAA
jgi:Protein of unknown function (DUF3592)